MLNYNCKTILIILSLACCCLHTVAQGGKDTLFFTLQEALEYADEHAFEAISASYDVEKAQKQVKEYVALGLPQVGLEARWTDNLSIQENVITMSPDDGGPPTYFKTKFGQQFNWNAQGTVSQMLFDGSYLLGVKAAKIYVEMEEKRKQKMQVNIREQVTQAYYLSLIAQETFRVFQDNLIVNKKTLQDIEAYYDQGFRELTDVDQLKLMVNTSKNLMLESQRQKQVADAVLKYALGVDMDQPIVLTQEISELLLPIEGVNVKEYAFDYTQHIDYSLLKTQEATQKILIKNEQAQYFPKLGAFYNYNYIEFGDQMSDLSHTNSQMLGLTLSMPIFSSGMRRAKVQQEKIAYQKVQNEMLRVQEALKRQVVVAESNFENAKATYLNNREGEQIAFRVYDSTQKKFMEGMVSSTELAQNEQQYIQAQMNYIESVLKLMESYVDLQKALDKL